MYSYGPPDMAGQKQDDQLEHTFSSYVRIQDVALKTYQRRWVIGRSVKRGSGISVLAAWHDDNDDDDGDSQNILAHGYFCKFPMRIGILYIRNKHENSLLDINIFTDIYFLLFPLPFYMRKESIIIL